MRRSRIGSGVPPLSMLRIVTGFLLVLTASPQSFAATLQRETVQAWDRYLAWADRKFRQEVSDPNRFLIEEFLPEKERDEIVRKLRSGEIVVKRRAGVEPPNEKFKVPDGEIHHWWGAILVPGVRLADLLKFLKDYDHHAGRFEDVEKSRLVSREGELYRFALRLRRSKAFVTAYYNTDQECVYHTRGAREVWSRSTATRIAEVVDPGSPEEKERPPGDDRGFLWRLVSWWRFRETDQGVVVECESASLSRDIPLMVKIIPYIASYIRSTPKESLESVLTSVRDHAPKK